MIAHNFLIYAFLSPIMLLIALSFLLYFCFICFYTKNPISFALIWLLGSISCFIFSFLLNYVNHKKLELPIWPISLFLAALFAACSIFFICELFILKRMFAFPQKEVDYIIILGAGLRKEKITKSLKYRLDTACDYLKKHPNTIVIVSGGMGLGETVTEAYAMKLYLMQKGIAENRIKQEARSTNTYENIFYSKAFLPKSDTSVAIVTNNFHLYRAEKIAQKQMLTNVQGIAAPSDKFLLIHFLVREGFAVLKYKLTGKS